jgi:hypothetical protein
MFEHYNLLDPIKRGAEFFFGWFPTRKLQDPTVTFLNSYTFIFWEMDFSNYVKNCIVWSKNTRTFRGSQNGFLRFWARCCEFSKILDFLKLFVKMRLTISFAGVQISYFLDLRIKSYGCLKFLGEVWAAKKLFIFKQSGVGFFFIDS